MTDPCLIYPHIISLIRPPPRTSRIMNAPRMSTRIPSHRPSEMFINMTFTSAKRACQHGECRKESRDCGRGRHPRRSAGERRHACKLAWISCLFLVQNRSWSPYARIVTSPARFCEKSAKIGLRPAHSTGTAQSECKQLGLSKL